MKYRTLAAGLTAAWLLAACGFVPPQPPKPANTARVPVNMIDPRFHAPAVATAPSPSAIVATAETAQAGQIPSPPSGSTAATPTPAVTVNDTDQSSVDQGQAATTAAAPTTTEPSASQAEAIADATRATEELPSAAPSDSDLVAQPVDLTAVGDGAAEVATEEAPPPPPPRIWQIDPSDGTVRQALARWAREDGWLFGSDQWRVNWDLPIEAPASFTAETFEEATRALADAIALSETPINPCFYENKVLRVIPYNQSCDRTTSHMVRP